MVHHLLTSHLTSHSSRVPTQVLVRPLADGFVRRASVASEPSKLSTGALPTLPTCRDAAELDDAMRHAVRKAARTLASAIGSYSTDDQILRKPPFASHGGEGVGGNVFNFTV